MEETFNPHVFDNTKSPNDPAMWAWRRKVWAECCSIGPGHVFVFDIARRGGKTRMAHHIATRGLAEDVGVTVVCASN